MKLIAGLGNPGESYLHSRHNVGFSVVKALAKERKAAFKKEPSTASWVTKVRIGPEFAILALPQTFMNLSGSAVSALLRRHRVDLADLLVVCDDMDLELGRLKLRPAGSSGGHRGVESVIAHLQTREFARLRIGIGRPAGPLDAADYVLAGFNRSESAQMKEAIDEAVRCCMSWVTQGMSKTMNTFNQRSKKDE